MKFLVFHSIRLIEFKIDDLPPKKRSKYRGDVTYTGASAVDRSGCRSRESRGIQNILTYERADAQHYAIKEPELMYNIEFLRPIQCFTVQKI
jgi:hypothetical protein